MADGEVEDRETGLSGPDGGEDSAVTRPLFENEEWTVTTAGLEHKRTGYFIEREHLAKRRSDGLWNWPAHMLEKSWVAPRAFTEAFLHAIRAAGHKPDPALELSFLPAGGLEIGSAAAGLEASEPSSAAAPVSQPARLGELVEIRVEVRRRAGAGRGAAAPARRPEAARHPAGGAGNARKTRGVGVRRP